jgi:hypothetical protein
MATPGLRTELLECRLAGRGANIDDSIPPTADNGSNTPILYLGNELYTTGSIKIAKWIQSVPPTRDQCNAG